MEGPDCSSKFMLKKIFLFFCFSVFLLSVVYLLLPPPAEPPPLPNSFKSIEPGDTVEIPGLFAYYTNMSREDVVSFYQKYFSRSGFLEIPLLTYRLNHPPEFALVVIKDTIHSSFFEELVHPFRESWYIDGYEPANDPFKKQGEKLGNFKMEGKEYLAKIIVLKKGSNALLRLLIFVFVVFSFWWLAYENIRRHR